MGQRVVYYNGRFVPEGQARVSIYDSALVVGDMAYEVTRTIGHRAFRLRQHLERLQGSLGILRIREGAGIDELESATLETLARNLPTEADDVDWQIIHNVSRGPAAGFHEAFEPAELRPTVIISCWPLTERLGRLASKYASGVDLVIPPQRSIPSQWLPTQAKVRGRLHYQLANLQAAEIQPGAWPVLLDPAGNVTEGTSNNVFIVNEGRLFTAPVDDVLAGVTRGLVLELAERLAILPVEEAQIPLALARRASEIFVTSTSIGILHARSLDGALIGAGILGPITARLRSALHDELGLDFAAQSRSYAARLGYY